MNDHCVNQKKVLGKFLITFILLIFILLPWRNAVAQDLPTQIPPTSSVPIENSSYELVNSYFSIHHVLLSDGTDLSGYVINGSPTPPQGYEHNAVDTELSGINMAVLPDFPSYNWVFGCSSVSAAMVAAYYDRNGYPNIYLGPTNGGVMPVTDTSWPLWSDGHSTYPNNPLIASHNGVDGRNNRGSIDNYWVEYNSSANDPYITNGWPQHTWGSSIGDYMKTSQSAYGNVDGSTSFYGYVDSNAKLTCSAMEGYGIANEDGTYGRKLFYQARGYSVTDCYNQSTDNTILGGFSLANFQAEINSGNPVILNLAGHSIVGFGYNGSTIYIRDTWDNDPSHIYTMPWGGSYANMQLLSVSIVHLAPPASMQLSFLPLVPNNRNRIPTNILLSNTMIRENQPINSVIGNFSTTDPNPGDTFTYSLVNGSGSSGNSSFNISGNKLRSSTIFDYETQNSYSIRVRSTDQGGLYLDKVFTIIVLPEYFFLNWNFELGPVNWQEYSTHGFELIVQPPDLIINPYDGSWAVWLGGYTNETSYIQQQVSIPSAYPYLSYMQWIASEDACGNDFAKVFVNGSQVETYNLCTATNTGGWVEHIVNLSAYAGTTATIQVKAECNGTLNSNLFIDHVTLQSSPKGGGFPPTFYTQVDASTPRPEIIVK